MAHADSRTENLELQIKKKGLELQILEARLRDYVPGPEQEHSLHELLWCENNLQHSLERVMARKNELLGLSASDQQPSVQNLDLMGQMEIENNGVPLAAQFKENDLTLAMQNPSSSQILTALDPWISPYSAKARESMLQNLLDEGKREPVYNPGPSNRSNFPMAGSSAFFESSTPQAQIPPAAYIPQKVASSDVNHSFVQNPSNFMPPRFTSTTVINAGKTVEMPQTQYYQTETAFVYPGPKLSNFTSLQGQEIGLMLPNLDSSIHFSKGSCSSGNGSNMIVYENGTGIFNEGINKEDESQASYAVPPLQEVGQDELFDSIPTDQGILEDNSFWPSKIQKTGSDDWDEFLREENFSVIDFTNNIEQGC
ncbi:Hypothetical predicted protein [Olea europaea subsp. europaea]|uniref:Uncharacterized protein n=1 Tax=Olea europaea subsp. europaea TaxID=158383 RepID=A0A8S0R1S8_OLEEU|nr:Hypothetical predicted protein [Olea europaea subsp. europaea]